MICRQCGHENPETNKFCGECAAPLKEPTRYVAEERKTVTALFCDLVGFTATSESADPEDVNTMLDTYAAMARAQIENHGGVVQKFIGDAVVGVFVADFGGRIRVWLLEGEGALGAGDQWLGDLARVFGLLPDTTAVALVESDLSCLIVLPEDLAPTIEVPRGSLVARRYRRRPRPKRRWRRRFRPARIARSFPRYMHQHVDSHAGR